MTYYVRLNMVLAACLAGACAGRQSGKRFLVDGNTGAVRKSRLTLDGSLVRPGIEYAPVEESERHQSPAQQSLRVYTTPAPLPQLMKISDLLTGAHSAFPTAISNHLFSPVQLYQPFHQFQVSTPASLTITQPRMTYVNPNFIQRLYQHVNNQQLIYNQRPVISRQPGFNHQLHYNPHVVVNHAQPSSVSYVHQPSAQIVVPYHAQPTVQYVYNQQLNQPDVAAEIVSDTSLPSSFVKNQIAGAKQGVATSYASFSQGATDSPLAASAPLLHSAHESTAVHYFGALAPALHPLGAHR